MKNLKTLKGVSKTVLIVLVAFMMFNFQQSEKMNNHPIQTSKVTSTSTQNISDVPFMWITSMKVEYERGTTEAEKQEIRQKFLDTLNGDVFLVGQCPGQHNVEIWDFSALPYAVALTRATDMEDDEDVKEITLQATCN